MYLVKRADYYPYYNEETWYFNKKNNAINKTIECFNNWIEKEYRNIQKWEEDTEWSYEEEITAIKTGFFDRGLLEVKEIETED